MPQVMSRETMPETLRNNDYYVGNDVFVQLAAQTNDEIIALTTGWEPWIKTAAQMASQRKSVREIARTLHKSQSKVSTTLKTAAVQQVVFFYQHLEVLKDGPNENLRKQMLWRIAVDNEKTDPKEATKALAELNRMTQAKGPGGGQTFNIVISNQVLQRGPLDG